MVRTLCAVALLTTLFVLPYEVVWATSGTMNVTSDTVLSENHTGNIIIGADNIMLDCDSRFVIGPGAGGAGIALVGRGGVTVENCIVMNFADGFSIRGSRANVFRRNLVIKNTDEGFDVELSIGNVFIQNTVISNGSDGFDLNSSDANFFGDNDVSQNAANGIEFDSCNGNVLERNNANDNGNNGISLDVSGGNFLERNIANRNGGNGFRIQDQSNDNRFIANIACQNRRSGTEGGDAFQQNSVRNWFIENGFCNPNNIGYIP